MAELPTTTYSPTSPADLDERPSWPTKIPKAPNEVVTRFIQAMSLRGEKISHPFSPPPRPQGGRGAPRQPGEDGTAPMPGTTLLPPGPAGPSPRQSESLRPSPSPAGAPELATLLTMVAALHVGEGENAPRQVRVRLSDASMPGVVAMIKQESGAWVAEFHCSDARSFATLRAHADQIARSLTDSLRCNAVCRVVPLAGDTEAAIEAHAWLPGGGK